MPVQTDSSKQPRRGDTRRQILVAALELFGRHGYDATTVRRVAEACGLRDPALYHYFRSKQEILESVLRERWTATTAERISGMQPGEMSAERLCSMADIAIESIAEQDTLIRLILRQSLADDAFARALRAERTAQWREAMVRQFDERFRPEDVETLVDSLMSVVMGIMLAVQFQYGVGLREAVRQPEFRQGFHRAIRRAVPIDRYMATSS